MSDMMDIRIMVLVGSNGKVMACRDGDMDWGDLQDGIMDWDVKPPKDPDGEARYILTAKVPLPKLSSPKVIEAAKIEEVAF